MLSVCMVLICAVERHNACCYRFRVVVVFFCTKNVERSVVQSRCAFLLEMTRVNHSYGAERRMAYCEQNTWERFPLMQAFVRIARCQ